MKIFTAIFIIITTAVLLTGCQNTATGFTNDFSRNTADVRKAINEN